MENSRADTMLVCKGCHSVLKIELKVGVVERKYEQLKLWEDEI
jgi:hypothetical protein